MANASVISTDEQFVSIFCQLKLRMRVTVAQLL